MNIITLDFETYFDDDYTLKKMTTESYIRDTRFEVLGVGVRLQTGETHWEPQGPKLKPFLQSFDWAASACLCHHAHFDGLILSHHFGVHPHAWLDTLSMARLVLGNHVSVGLDNLARHFGLQGKTVPYDLFKGRHWTELAPDTQRQLSAGCLHDIELTWHIFGLLAKDFPPEEYPVIDATIRMFTEPQLRGDVELLGKVWTDERRRKRELLTELGITAKELGSNEKLAGMLRQLGVEPPTKQGKNEIIYAFAQKDEGMKELLAHEDERVRLLAEARLEVKSNIDESRAARLGWMASRGSMPVYLSYCGAHTTRWSGGDGANWQNFRRGGEIRKAIQAPPNSKLAIVDLSQIECRILNYLAGEQDVLEAFKKGDDLYSEGASRFYGRSIGREDKTERHLGKVLELGCGYGMGADKLRATCRLGALGGPPIYLSATEATTAIDSYRRSHSRVCAYWKTASRMIARLAGGDPVEWGPMTVMTGRIVLPNGAPMLYPELHYRDEEQEWTYRTRNGRTKLYGGKLTENVVQALARLVLSQACLRIKNRLSLLPVLLAHDEGVWVLPDGPEQAGQFEVIKEEMTREPMWLPGIPLAAEGVLSERYEK